MKKKILTIVALLFLPMFMSAQNEANQDEVKRHEVQISVGTFWFLNDFNSSEPGDYDHYYPPISVGYMYNKSSKWSFGLHLSYLYNREKVTYYQLTNALSENTESDYTAFYNRYKDHLFSLMATARMKWCRHHWWNMYSRVGAGPALLISKQAGFSSKVSGGAVFQFTPVAVEAGTDKVRGFFELGFGCQGLLNAGVSYRF